jgi:hypothetical protein
LTTGIDPEIIWGRSDPVRRNCLKRSKYLVLLIAVLIAALFFIQGNPAGWSDAGENHCVSCHTTPRQLIGSVRELEKERGSGAKVSLETEGEG